MNPNLKDIREISDSKEMYEARPHPFISIFISILLGCIVLGFVWMYFGEIDIVSKGKGIVRPNENTSAIRSKVQGEVIAWNLEEGKQVDKGEVLFTVAYDDLNVKRLQATEILKETEHTLNQLKKLRDSIKQDKNLFSSKVEKEYYDRYVKYNQDYETLKNEMLTSSKDEMITTTQTKINRKMCQDKIEEYDKEINILNQFKSSIQIEENVFTDKNCVEALAFNTYLFKVHELKKDIADKKISYELNESLGQEELIGKKVLEDSRVALEFAKNELTTFRATITKEIVDQINELNIAKQIAQQEMDKLIIDAGLMSTNQSQRDLNIQKYKTDILVRLYNQIDEIELAYNSKKRELESIELAIKECTVTAPISGTINMIQTMSKGDWISVGMDVATIIPIDDSLYKIEIFIPNREIAGIKEGDTINYKFDALPYKEYGKLDGKIIKISTDAKVNSSQSINGYSVQGSIENKTVYSYKDEPTEIKIGMTCEAHIVTEQKKILFYLLEKINLMN